MTKLEPGKSITRETATLERGDPLVIELHPRHLIVRIKGFPSTAVMLDYGAVYDLGRKLASRRLAAEKGRKRGGAR